MLITISRTFNRSLHIKLRIRKDKAKLKNKIVPKKPRLNLPNQVQMSLLSETNTDFSALYWKLEDNIKTRMGETKLQTRKDWSFVTTSYQRMLDFLQKNECKYGDFLQSVVIGNKAAPSFSLIFASELHPGKKACFNSIMKD